jgi:hypothetical protein
LSNGLHGCAMTRDVALRRLHRRSFADFAAAS